MRDRPAGERVRCAIGHALTGTNTQSTRWVARVARVRVARVARVALGPGPLRAWEMGSVVTRAPAAASFGTDFVVMKTAVHGADSGWRYEGCAGEMVAVVSVVAVAVVVAVVAVGRLTGVVAGDAFSSSSGVVLYLYWRI
jgi:hypothetical protein